MGQICTRFDKKIEEKLRQRATKKEISIADYVRNLVDIGLRVEEANAKKHQTSGDLKTIIDLLTVALVAIKETQINTRRTLLYTNNTEESSEAILKRTLESAKAYVEGYLSNSTD